MAAATLSMIIVSMSAAALAVDPKCAMVKDQYKEQGCCGAPSKAFNVAPLLDECNICVVGCSPYTDTPWPLWTRTVQTMASQCSLMVHVGDTQSGSASCNETTMAGPLEVMVNTGVPTLYAIGDNEATDCHRAASAGTPAQFYKAEDARNFFINKFFKDTTTDLTGTLPVTTMSKECPFNVYVEKCNAAVVTLEVTGSQWYLADESAKRPMQNTVDPLADRLAMYTRAKDCAVDWLDTSFARAHAAGLRAIFIMFHAKFWISTDATKPYTYGEAVTEGGFGGDIYNVTTLGHLPFQPLSDKFFKKSEEYPDMMIYLVHADWHFWHVQSPKKVKNIVEVMLEGSTNALTTYGRFSVDPHATFDPVTVKEMHVE